MATIAFYAHPTRPEAAALAERASVWLAERGHRAIMALQADDSVAIDGADLLVSLGATAPSCVPWTARWKAASLFSASTSDAWAI